MEDNLKKLYDNVSREYDLPDFDTFKTDMQDSTKLRRLYDNVGQTFDLPDYETFVADMGLGKKKVPTEPSVENFQPVTKEEESFLAPSSVSGSKPKTAPEKRQTSVAGDLLRTLKSTSLKALGGITAIPELGDKTIDRLVAYPIAKAMMPDADEETIKLAIEGMDYASPGSSNLEGLANLGSGAQDRLSKVAARTDVRMKQIEGGIIENFKQGNVGEAFEQLARGVVGTIPYLAEVAITAGGGAPAVLGSIGATAASQQYGEIKGREDLSEGKKVLNSWLYGGFEAAGELVTAGILNRTLRALKGTAPSKQVVDNLAKSLAKKFGLVAGQGGEEAASEMATQIGQNLTAMWTGENPDVGVFDGVLDAGLIGFVPGAGMGSVQAAVSGRAVATKKDIDAVNKSHEAQATIIEQIEDAETPAAKEILERELAAEKDKEYEVIDKNIEIAQSLTEEQLTEVGKLQAARTELDAKLVSNEVTKEERSTIEAMAENIDEQIETIKTTPETPSGASGVESVSGVKSESGTQVSPEANVPIPTQDIIETPTEITGEVATETEATEIAPQKEALPEKSTFNFDTEEMVIGRDLVDDIKAVEDAARTMPAKEFGDYWLTAINKIWEEGGRKTTERSRAFETYFKSILPEGELLAGTPIREAILGTIGKRQIVKTDDILVKALNGEVVDKIDDKGKAILEELVSFTGKKYPGKKLGISIGSQPISVAGSDGFRMTIPNVEAPISDMFPYDAKLVIPAYEALEKEGADRRTLWAAHDWFHEMAHTEGIENEKEADAFAVKHVREFISSCAETPQVEAPQESDKYKGLSNSERNGVKFAEALPSIMNRAFAMQKPFKDAFLRGEGLTEEKFNKLPQGEKDVLQEKWAQSRELRDLEKHVEEVRKFLPNKPVFHGTPRKFAEFNTDNGVYFTPNKKYAEHYKGEIIKGSITSERKETPTSSVVEAVITINNPKLFGKDYTLPTAKSYYELTPEKIRQYKEQGYDGLIFVVEGKVHEYVVFDKAQIDVVQKPEDFTGREQEVKVEQNKESSHKKEEGFSYDVNWYDIKNQRGDIVGNIVLLDRGDYYQVQNAKVETPRKGIGLAAYKQLIARLDKPLYSDTSMTQPAHGLWNKLVAEGLAEQFKENIGSEKKPNVISRYRTVPPQVAVTEVEQTPPPAEPPVVEQTEQPEGEERTILRRVVESAEIDQEVKNDLLEQGIEYIPRGRKFTQPEAKALIDVYASIEGGIDKLFSAVRDMANGIAPDTRTVLNVYVAEQYSKQLEAATDTKTREQLRRKVADAFMFGAELATTYGQAVEAQKKWQEILARDPEAIITIKKRRQTENNKEALKEMAGDLKASREFLEENIANNEEFKKLVEERVSEEIDKIANKKYGKIDKKKIDDFFKGLEIPTDKLFDAAIGLPVAVYNGSLQIIKRAVLAGADLINAINQAVDYINQWYKDKYDSGEIPSPDWNKDDYVATMTDRLKPLTKKVKKVRYKLPKKAEENIVDKLYDKMASATKPQLRRLVREYVATLEEEGAVSSERFRDLFAQAIGLEVLSQQDEQVIRLAGQSINHARKKAETLMEAYNEFLKESGMETPDKDKLATLEAEIKQKKKAANKARFAAQKAAQQLDKLLQEEIELGQTISTLIQGNLLTPISLASNIIGNITFIPVRGVKTMIASALDNMVYGLAKAYAPMLKKIDPQKNPRLARMAEGLPTPQRIYRNFAALQGFGVGFARGGKEGAVQLITGQLADDIYRREMARGLEPVKAAMRLRDQLTGKEQARFDKILSDFLEAMPAGYMAEAFFRGLNFGDKPFRRAAETARLYEIAQIKGLRGKAREAFLANPDVETLDEMRKAGEVSVYQQDSFVSDLMKYVQQKLNKVGATNDHKRRAIVAKTLGHLVKATTIPFVKTPVNLIAEAFDYAIPVVTAARGVYAMKNGQRRKATELFAKAIVGQMMVSLAIYLLKNGLLTPPSDDDDKIRQAQYEGKRGYSFNPDAIWRSVTKGDTEWKDGDRVWSYQRLGVPSMILMGVAKAYQSVPQDKMAELSYFERNISMLPSIASGSLDQSFLTGVSTALSAFMEGEAKFNDWMINTTKAMSAVIYPNTLAQISQTFFSDNYIREVRDMYSEEERLKRRMTNTFKDRLFMSKDLPTKVTIWGEDVKRIPEGRSWPYMFFDVTKETKYQRTTFGVKMYEMYERYRLVDEEEAKNIIPSLPSATVEVGWDKRNMTAMEVNELQKKVGTLRRMYVERLMSSEEWMDMTDEERITELQSIYRDASTKVKSEMFMLDIVKASDKWEFLRANDFIPVPTSSITINGKRITGEEAANFYDQVQRLFVLELGGMPDGKVSDDMREDYKKDVEKAWARAKKDITNEWRDKIPEPEE